MVAAIGKANFVKGEWLKPGAVLIDVGINSVDDAAAPRGYRLVGDADFASCAEVCSAITPVPGGVGECFALFWLHPRASRLHLLNPGYPRPNPPATGPMTIAMLLSNTVDLFEGRKEE